MSLLNALGNGSPTNEVIAIICGWARLETTPPGGAAFNPLNTTQTWPNSTFFNCLHRDPTGVCLFGVRNYASFQDGIDANAYVLTHTNGIYLALVNALKNNDLSSLGWYSGVPSGAVLDAWGHWVGHNAAGYAHSILQLARQPGITAIEYTGAGSGGGGGIGISSGKLNPANYNVGQLCEYIDQQLEVTNPLADINPDVWSNPLFVIKAFPVIVTNFLLDLKAILFRLALIAVGVFILMRIVQRLIPTEKLGEVAQVASAAGGGSGGVPPEAALFL